MSRLAPAALGFVTLCKNWWKWRKSRDFVVFLFLDTFEYNKMSRNRRNDKIPWESHLFKGLCCFSCFLAFFAIKSSRNRKNDKIPWSRHFFQGILLFLMFLDIFCNKKCLETGETTKSLEQGIFFKGYCCFSCFTTSFWNQNCLETGKPLENNDFCKGFGRFFCF